MTATRSGILLAHPTGNANVRAAALAFHRAGYLRQFHSCLCWNKDAPIAKLLPATLRVELERRSFPDLPLSLQHSHPWRETFRLASEKLGWQSLLRHETGLFCIYRVLQSFDQSIATVLPRLPALSCVYAYEDAALSTFQAAQHLGLRRIYELPIGYWQAARRIFAEESELQPEWACTLSGLRDSRSKLDRKEAELKLADLVVVPSEFVRSTLLRDSDCNVPVAIVPFGSPTPTVDRPTASFTKSGPLKVLYVGSLGQRKGVAYLLQAIEELGSDVHLTLVGKPVSLDCRPLMAALQRYRWIPSLPHGAVLEQMRQHDVLVLPSLFEGYALVISEALSQGLPVITTANSGGTESIREGVEGFIVPIRDSIAIANRLLQLSADRQLLAEMGQACLRRAAELSWYEYQKALLGAVAPLLNLCPDHG